MTAEIELTHLSPFARKIANYIIRRHPEWIKFFIKRKDKPTELLIKIPCPNENIKSPLIISTDDMEDEIMVSFDWWHDHFEIYDYNNDEAELFKDVIDRIEEIITEKLVFAFGMKKDDWDSSRAYYQDEKIDVDIIFRDGADRILFRSWSGRYDKEIFQ